MYPVPTSETATVPCQDNVAKNRIIEMANTAVCV